MKTKLFYYFILFVYVSLWICQLIACHLTHSLIILTDSYINLYRIFDISLGILHLSTQQNLAKNRGSSLGGGDGCGASDHARLGSSSIVNKNSQTLAYKMFESACTYQYKRLPLLGSFVNGMFLAALLMSAAIEGLQTCFHVQHSENHNKTTILTENVATYPLILAGFAIVGLIMQYCSLKAHEMREEELCSESLLDLTNESGSETIAKTNEPNGDLTSSSQNNVICIQELNVNHLAEQHKQKRSSKRRSYDLNLNTIPTTPTTNHRPPSSASGGSNQSLQELKLAIRTSELPHDEEESRISLKSLRFSVNLDRDLEASKCPGSSIILPVKRTSLHRDNWFFVRCLASPIALLICAIIFYLVDVELATEISDAALAVSVVVLLFAASYPPMKKAGKILLQTVPEGVNLEKLKRELERCSGDIIQVDNLHVWSLTPRSNRVATCQLLLDMNKVTTKQQVQQIIQEAKYKFLDQRIKCTTIEPVLSLRDSQKQQQQNDADH